MAASTSKTPGTQEQTTHTPNFEPPTVINVSNKFDVIQCFMGALAGSAVLRRVTDANKVAQFAALLRPRLAGRGYRLLYTWSRDGRSNASFHQRCDNQVRGEMYKGF